MEPPIVLITGKLFTVITLNTESVQPFTSVKIYLAVSVPLNNPKHPPVTGLIVACEGFDKDHVPPIVASVS